MFLKKSLSFFAAALSFILFSCEFFNSFSDGYNPVTRFSFAANSLSVAAGNFQQIPIDCKPDSEQPKLDISWSYDESVIALVPDNFTPAVYGIKAGSSVLKASINGFSTSCVVTVAGSSPSATAITPYVYSSASFVSLTPDGEQVRVTASLAGGAPNDISGFSFEAEHSGIVSIVSEGNAAWLRGLSPGMTRVTVRHSRSSFPYAFIVSCSADSVNFPYITTESNIVTINKSVAGETSFSVSMANPNSFIYDSDYRFELLDSQYSTAADPPAAISANGKNCTVTPLKAGECFVRVSHNSPEVFYPLDVLVIVYEQIENAYIEIPEPIVYVSGSSAAAFSVSLANLPQGVSADPSGFVWTFPDNASSFVDFNIYGGGSFGTGNSLWLSGKKSGSFPVSVAHPLAANKRTFYVVVRNIAGEAVDASAYITTSQNYVLAAAGSDPVSIMVVLYNIEQGGENLLVWSAEHTAADGSANPVLEYASATGSYTSSFSRTPSARSLNYAPTAAGNLVITPLREGTAVISVSHPKAFYDTKIIVSVLPENEPVAEKPFLLSSFNLLTALLNGESAAIDVSIDGGSVSAEDESAVSWMSSDPSRLSIAGGGTSAFVSACGTGFSRNTVTVTHPKALSPLILTVICADDEAQILAAKYVLSMNYSYVVEESQQVYISAFINNEEPGDSLVWNVPSGLNSVVSIAQTGPHTVSVTGLKNGLASLTASIAGNSDPNAAASFQILVSSAASPPSQAAYLTTSDNVVVLGPHEEKSVSVSSVSRAARAPIPPASTSLSNTTIPSNSTPAPSSPRSRTQALLSKSPSGSSRRT